MLSHAVMSDSLWPYGLRPARLLCPWDSPSKNTGVGCHALPPGDLSTQGLNLRLLADGSFTTSTTWEAPCRFLDPLNSSYRSPRLRIPFLANFCERCKIYVYFFFFACECTVVTAPFVEKTILSVRILSSFLCQRSVPYICVGLFLASVLFHWFILSFH